MRPSNAAILSFRGGATLSLSYLQNTKTQIKLFPVSTFCVQLAGFSQGARWPVIGGRIWDGRTRIVQNYQQKLQGPDAKEKKILANESGL